MGLILTPGSKARMLNKLRELRDCVEHDSDRETIMFRTAGLIEPVVNQFAYYNPTQDPLYIKLGSKKKGAKRS